MSMAMAVRAAFWLWSRRVSLRPSQTKRHITTLQPSTKLEKIIHDSIRAGGPISVSEYTQLCLSHPTEGYYMRERSGGADVFGAKGDFITSPEISQVFGELVGIWLLSQWLDSNSNKPTPRRPKLSLIELGPGRGTLMDDIIRTFSNWPNAKAAISSVHLVETSPMMLSRQRDKLSHWFRDLPDAQLYAHTSIEDVPRGSEDQFNMVIAHELFDALPTNILEKTSDGFREVLIDLRTSGSPSSPFHFVLSSTPTARSELLCALSPRFAKLPLGSRLEVSSAGWRTARAMSQLISGSATMHTGDQEKEQKKLSENLSGAGLIIDYGEEHVFGSSFRAFKNHRLADVFETPGKCDLTTNVDFALLKEACKGIATAHGPLPQVDFLLRMGIRERLAALAKQAPNEERSREITRAGNKLIDRSSQGMGSVYRVLGLTSLSTVDGSKDQVWPFVDISKPQ